MKLKKRLPQDIGEAIGPFGGLGSITLIPVFVQNWAVDFGTASLSINLYMAPFIIILILSGSLRYSIKERPFYLDLLFN